MQVHKPVFKCVECYNDYSNTELCDDCRACVCMNCILEYDGGLYCKSCYVERTNINGE